MSTTVTADAVRVAVLGAGPIGLDAALAAADAGARVTVLEAGPTVGCHVRAWGHVQLFTPWSMSVSARMRRHLAAAGVAVPIRDDTCPTGDELAARLLEPVAALPALAGAVRTGTRVVGVARRGLLKHEAIGAPERARAPFRLLLADSADETVEWTEEADVVLDATGSYGTANALGDGGVLAPGERALDRRIVRHLPDVTGNADRWRGRRVLLVGAGKSAQTAARDLAATGGVEVDWVVRSPAPGWGAVPGDPLPERDALVVEAERLRGGGHDGVRVHAGTTVETLRRDGDAVAVALTDGTGLVVDDVVALTGYVGDPALYQQLQVHECYATGAPMGLAAALLAAAGDGGVADCLAQPAQGVDVLRSPEPDFFVLGAKSYGRTSTFLLRVGYEQVDVVAAVLPVTAGA